MSNNKDFVVAGAVEVGKDTKVTLGSITSSDIDLATGNYFADTLAADTTYTISNAGDVQAFQLEVTGGAVYDLSGSSYDSKSFSVSSYHTVPSDVFFKPDGTKMYTVGNGDDVNQFALSTAWDVSTAVYETREGLVYGSAEGFFIKPDGTAMYYLIGQAVYQSSLSTAWDVSTSTYVIQKQLNAETTTPTGVVFKPDGTKMYVCANISTGQDINEYTLSTPWSIATASYVQNFSVASQQTDPQGFAFSSDGTILLLAGITADEVHQYNLSTAWDISTASYSNISFSTGGQEVNTKGIFWKPDRSKFYIIGFDGDSVYQYSSEAPTTVTWPSSIEWAGGVAPAAPAAGETDVFTLVTDDGGTSYVGLKTADALS